MAPSRVLPRSQSQRRPAIGQSGSATCRGSPIPCSTTSPAETLKARMPVEQAAGAKRESVTHLEALGRLIAGIAPWLELAPDNTDEGRLRARYAELARRAIDRAVDPASKDFLNFTRERQPLVDAAFLAQGVLRAPRALARRARRHHPPQPDRRAGVVSGHAAGVQQLVAVLGNRRSRAGKARRQLGSDARGLRAAPARPVVQGRRRLRRRPRVPFRLLQQLRHSPDAAGRAGRVQRRRTRRGRTWRRASCSAPAATRPCSSG